MTFMEWQQCVWCHDGASVLTEDHVFPRCIGGTKHLKLPACRKCQRAISDAETEFCRRSVFALYSLDNAPSGRHKQRSKSGALRTDYVLNRHPLGGYGETVLKVGSGIQLLPYIEIDVSSVSPKGNARGASPGEIDRLVSVYRDMLARAPQANGLVCEIDVRTDDLGEIGSDPSFWPRIVLGLDDKLFIRCRNPEEAAKFIDIFTKYVRFCYTGSHPNWVVGKVQASELHHLQLTSDEAKVYRVISKIGLGTMFAGQRSSQHLPQFDACRRFIRGEDDDSWRDRVQEIFPPGTLSHLESDHVAMIHIRDGRAEAVLSIFGSCHVAQLGQVEAPELRIPIVAASSRIGRLTRLLEGIEASEVIQKLIECLPPES